MRPYLTPCCVYQIYRNGSVAIKKKPGYIVNSLLVPLLVTGLDLLQEENIQQVFQNTEEETVGLTNVVLLLEDELTKQGA
jgi:hypothetical protein